MKAAALGGLLLAVCLTGTVQAQGTYGKWVARKSLEGYDAISTPATTGGRAVLDLLCPAGGLSVRMQFGTGLGSVSDEQVRVKLDFDKSGEPPTNWAHAFSPTNSLLTLARGRVSTFVAHAKRAAELRVRITDPLNGPPVDLAFSLEGFPDALAVLPCAKGL